LIVEDSPEDAALIIGFMEHGGFDVEHETVATAIAMKRALAERDWDAVVCDYSLPGFDVFGALVIFKERHIDIPFIIVSGSIEQDTAVAAMKAGAHDYLLKDNLHRLVPALRREIDEANVRESRRQAERELANVKEELARQLSDMTCLHQLGVRLSTAVDLESIMVEILTAVTSLHETDAGALVLFDNHQKTLVIAASIGFEDVAPDTLVIPSLGISQRAVIERRTMTVDVDTSSSGLIYGDHVRNASYPIAQSMPLYTRGGVLLGCLETYQRQPATSRIIRLVELYTYQAGQVLDNMMLHRETENASRMKDEFVAIVSHELRTPLTPIIGAVHMVRSDPGNVELLKRALDIVERNARAQAQIIEDLLDVSGIVSGKLHLNLTPIDLKSVIEASVQTVTASAEVKDISIDKDLQTLHGFVLGDFGRLQQIVWNLLSNAVKFTPRSGRIHIALRSVERLAEIIVKDSGIGISSEFLPYVFDRFRQADSSSTRAHGGLGLGLAIVRQLVEMHGGTVAAESMGNGQGSSFVVRLPLREASQSAQISPDHRRVG